jgi:hypothetical protein
LRDHFNGKTCVRFVRDHSKRKARVQFVYVLPEVLHDDFLLKIKYLVNLECETKYICLIVLVPDFMTKNCKKAAQDFHCAVSKVFDRVKPVALWSANIR